MDPALTYLWVKSNTTGAKEMITTTPEHPFYLAGNVDGSTRPAPIGHEDLSARWVGAGHLKDGDRLRMADGTQGTVVNVRTEQETREMFNLTVQTAHTFYVGKNGWLVHNVDPTPCDPNAPAMPDKYQRRKAGYERPETFTAEKNCIYCQKEMDPDTSGEVDSIEFDHLVGLKDAYDMGAKDWTPVQWKEFANDLDNLVQSCKSCNASKGARQLFDKWIPKNMEPTKKAEIEKQITDILKKYGLK